MHYYLSTRYAPVVSIIDCLHFDIFTDLYTAVFESSGESL